MPRPSRKGLRVLIIDDEALARHRLIDLLRASSRSVTITEARNGAEAIAAIEKETFDVAFLDVQMPEISGLDVIRAIGPDQMPQTIFVTAFDTHAVEAFETNALDYLLKPFSEERFNATLKKVEARIKDPKPLEFSQHLSALAFGTEAPDYWDRVVVKVENTTRLVPVSDVDLFESAGVYVTLHVGGKEILHRAPMHALAERLDPKYFIRVNRSAIVNLESVLQLDPMSHGEFEAVLKHGVRTKVTRFYRANLEARLGQAL